MTLRAYTLSIHDGGNKVCNGWEHSAELAILAERDSNSSQKGILWGEKLDL